LKDELQYADPANGFSKKFTGAEVTSTLLDTNGPPKPIASQRIRNTNLGIGYNRILVYSYTRKDAAKRILFGSYQIDAQNKTVWAKRFIGLQK